MISAPPLQILLAEDERSVAFSIAFALKVDRHSVDIACDGAAALADLKAKPQAFDLLITDHSMPGMNGIDLVTQVRDTAFGGPIMVLSAHVSAENRTAYSTLGVDVMIPKPFDIHELRAAVRRIASSSPLRLQAKPISDSEAYSLLRLGLPENEPQGERSR
jgi:DNA-binding response OmpR family regulator